MYVKETMNVHMTADLMFEKNEAIWVEIRQSNTKYLVSYMSTDHLPRQNIMKKIVDMFECARMIDHPIISLCDLNFSYILDETLST